MIVHASAVAFCGRGALITGAAGSGKSSLALQLMAFNAVLIADDRVLLSQNQQKISATAAPNLSGMIEARGIGILHAEPAKACEITLVVDLDTVETERLPPERVATFLDVDLPMIHKIKSPAFPAAILQYLRTGKARA